MYGDNVFCLQQLAGDKCIIGVHSEVAADRQNCIFKSIELGQQLHIAEECGVTGEVQLRAVEINDNAAGVTTGNAAAVEGQCQAYLAEGKLKGAAKMHSVCFAAGILRQTLLLLAIVRLMLPDVLLPATTALGTIEPDGREQGVMAGANVVMPNLSPMEVRKKYMLYDNKISTGVEAAANIKELKRRMASIGYEVVTDRGDHKKNKRSSCLQYCYSGDYNPSRRTRDA